MLKILGSKTLIFFENSSIFETFGRDKIHYEFLFLCISGLAESRPSVLKGDKIFAQLSSDTIKGYEGIVHEVQECSIIVGFSHNLTQKFLPNMQFNIRFTFNRFPLRNMHRAAEFMTSNSLEQETFIFPKIIEEKTEENQVKEQKNIRFFDSKIESNKEQSTAVNNIVDGGLPGIPYIIFGPPGNPFNPIMKTK